MTQAAIGGIPGRAIAPATNVAVTAMPAGRKSAVAYPGGGGQEESA
jgi:hypothetical protein